MTFATFFTMKSLELRGLPELSTKNGQIGSSHHGAAEMNLTKILEDAGSIPGLGQRVKDPVLP